MKKKVILIISACFVLIVTSIFLLYVFGAFLGLSITNPANYKGTFTQDEIIKSVVVNKKELDKLVDYFTNYDDSENTRLTVLRGENGKINFEIEFLKENFSQNLKIDSKIEVEVRKLFEKLHLIKIYGDYSVIPNFKFILFDDLYGFWHGFGYSKNSTVYYNTDNKSKILKSIPIVENWYYLEAEIVIPNPQGIVIK